MFLLTMFWYLTAPLNKFYWQKYDPDPLENGINIIKWQMDICLRVKSIFVPVTESDCHVILQPSVPVIQE